MSLPFDSLFQALRVVVGSPESYNEKATCMRNESESSPESRDQGRPPFQAFYQFFLSRCASRERQASALSSLVQ